MELHQLKTFYHVANLLNFSKAAEAVSLSQPAVSRQIEALEKHFGIDLFYRIGKKIELTDAGRRLLFYCEQLLDLAQQTEEAMNAYKNIDSGEITIGASTTVGNYILSPLVMEFNERHPNIKANLVIEETAKILSEIRNGSIDVAIVAKTENEKDFFFQPLFKDEILLFTSTSSNSNQNELISIKDIDTQKLLLRKEGSNTRKCVDLLFSSHEVIPKDIIELNTNEAIKHSIIRGYGIGFLSTYTTKLEVDNHLLVPMKLKETCWREFSIVSKKGKFTSPIMLVLTSFLKKNIKKFLISHSPETT